MERGILASLAAIAIANEEAGPAELLWRTQIVKSDANNIPCQLIVQY